jgi:myotubularin-related protein 5/13
MELQEEDTVDGENPHPRRLTGSLTRSIATIAHHSIMYAPKCLVLVSRLDYIETFRVNKLLRCIIHILMKL